MKKSYLTNEHGEISPLFVNNMIKSLNQHREYIPLALIVIFVFPAILFLGVFIIEWFSK